MCVYTNRKIKSAHTHTHTNVNVMVTRHECHITLRLTVVQCFTNEVDLNK